MTLKPAFRSFFLAKHGRNMGPIFLKKVPFPVDYAKSGPHPGNWHRSQTFKFAFFRIIDIVCNFGLKNFWTLLHNLNFLDLNFFIIELDLHFTFSDTSKICELYRENEKNLCQKIQGQNSGVEKIWSAKNVNFKNYDNKKKFQVQNMWKWK